MKTHRTTHLIFAFLFLLTACAKKAQALPPTATIAPTETSTAAPTAIPTATLTPEPTTDPTIFGAIGTGEIQAFTLEPVASAIFQKTMDGFVANGSVSEYQIMSVIILRADTNLLAELTYNVKSSDALWLNDGGTSSADGWINGNCARFDLIITDTEYQLKNKRLCS
jgi:hypothetical protein